MSFRKPFRPAPVRIGPYHRSEKRRADLTFAAKALASALAAGLFGGALSVPSVRQHITDVSVASGLTRARAPQLGDH